MIGRGYILVEGHGETKATGNLVTRLWQDMELPFLVWRNPRRWLHLDRQQGVAKGCELIRRQRDTSALLILRDDEDACPKETGPKTADWIASLKLPFPTAVVLLYREYETLFLPCAAKMAGKPLRDDRGVERPGLVDDARFDGDPESTRGAKEWLTRHFPQDRSYKPTLDQLPMTRLLDFPTIRTAKVPCFETLERALQFLAANLQAPHGVYPPPENR